MELWRELLIYGLQSGESEFIDNKTIKEIVKDSAYEVLFAIKEVLDNLLLSDEECFCKIEEIIYALEKRGVFTDRHDFG